MNQYWRDIIDNHNYAAAHSHLLDREYMDRFATTSAEDLNAALYEVQERRAVPSEQLLNMIASTYLQTHKLAYQNAKARWHELDDQNSLFEEKVLIPRHHHLLGCANCLSIVHKNDIIQYTHEERAWIVRVALRKIERIKLYNEQLRRKKDYYNSTILHSEVLPAEHQPHTEQTLNPMDLEKLIQYTLFLEQDMNMRLQILEDWNAKIIQELDNPTFHPDDRTRFIGYHIFIMEYYDRIVLLQHFGTSR